jgi:UDP-glucose 4-epimerase
VKNPSAQPLQPPKKYLVTGGAGYVGSTVAADLIAAGHEVVVYDNLSRGHREMVPRQATLVVADVADRAELNALFAAHRFDGVLHFAASIEVGESMVAPERFFANNTANTLGLLETMLAHGVKTFVFSSTAALFGNPEQVPVREDAPLAPTNAYGESKLLVERVLTWYHAVHGLRYASLRYFNAAGATQVGGESHHPESHLIPLVLQVAQGRRPHIQIFGSDYPTPDGTCIRDYVHIADLSGAHLLALQALDRNHRDGRLIYNLGNGHGFSVLEVVETARRITGHPIPVVLSPRRAGDPAVLVACSDRIRDELGWQPRYSDLEAIIASAWHWHSARPWLCAVSASCEVLAHG